MPLEEWAGQLERTASRITPVLLEATLSTPAAPAKPVAAVHRKRKLRAKWAKTHEAVRAKLGLPAKEELKRMTLGHSPQAAALPPRMQDLLGLHWEVAKRNGIPPEEHHFVWDLTNSVHFACAKDPKAAGTVPCVLRRHVYWDTALRRQMTGAELMRVH
eukprot:5628243-Lingulodinium_polyedra.AAC.1